MNCHTFFEAVYHASSEIGIWILVNLSVEGVIALPALMASLLVALAIYNFEDSRSGLLIDAPTIMTQVVKVQSVIWSFVLVSVFAIFFEISEQLARLIVPMAVLYLIGLLLLTQSLQRSYGWARSLETGKAENVRAAMREAYLAGLNDKEKRAAWEKIWQSNDETRSLMDQRQLIRVFVYSIEQTRDKEEIAPWILEDFISALGKIHLNDPVILKELLHFCLGHIDKLVPDTDKSDDGKMLGLHMTTERLFFAIFEQVITMRAGTFYSFIRATREYLEKNSIKEVAFIEIFAPNFLEAISKIKRQDGIWSVFPDSWKVTTSNLKDDVTRTESLAWFNAYADWMTRSSNSEYGQYDSTLDSITRELLPKINPILWGRLFILHWSGFEINEGESPAHAMVRNFVERPHKIGGISRVKSYFVSDGETEIQAEFEAEEYEVLELVAKTNVFPIFHDQEEMKKIFSAIRLLEKERVEDKDNLRELQALKQILEKVRKHIRESKCD